MSKSIYVVGGIGAFGCLALSLMMQHVLKVKTEADTSPLAGELQDFLAEQLTAPVLVDTLDEEGRLTTVIKMWTRPGVQRERFGRSASDLVWRLSGRILDEVPEQLRIEVFTREPVAEGDKSAPAPQEDGDRVVVRSYPPGSLRSRTVRRIEPTPQPEPTTTPVAPPRSGGR